MRLFARTLAMFLMIAPGVAEAASCGIGTMRYHLDMATAKIGNTPLSFLPETLRATADDGTRMDVALAFGGRTDRLLLDRDMILPGRPSILRVSYDLATPSETIVARLRFPETVSGARFRLTGVDRTRDTTKGHVDRVDIAANGPRGPATPHATTIERSPTHVHGRDGRLGLAPSLAGPFSDTGRFSDFDIRVPERFRDLTLSFSSATLAETPRLAVANPTTQMIGVTDMYVCGPDPAASSLERFFGNL